MAKHDLPALVSDLLYAHDHRLLNDPVGSAMKHVIDAGVADDFVVGWLRNCVAKHQIACAFAGPFRSPQLFQGEIVLGLDLQDRPVRMPVQFFNAHSLTVSGSGAGKTFRSRWLALQIARWVGGCWLFDLRKREWTVLEPYLAQLGINLITVPARSLRLNPLQVPPNVDPRDYASRVADLLVQVLRLPARADKLVHATVLELYDSFGVLRAGNCFPTLFDLRETIAHNKSANPPARQAIVDSLDPVLLSLRDVLCFRRGWSTNALARHHLVFELGGIAETDKDLILNTLLIQEFSSRIARGVSNGRMNLWICCDEAQRTVSAVYPTGGIADLISLVRGVGIGLDLSVQTSDVAPSILSNTCCKFLGRFGNPADADSIGSAMGLTAEQRRYLTHTLVPGMFVGQVGEGDWRYPFLFRVPFVDFSREPANTDESGSFRAERTLPPC